VLRRGFFAVLAVLALLTFIGTSPALASGPVTCPSGSAPNPTTGTCQIVVTTPGSGGGGGGGGSNARNSGGAAPEKCVSKYSGKEMPCRDGNSYWSNDRGCYIGPDPSNPPKTDPVWEGHTDGAIYLCYSPDIIGTNAYSFWSLTPPAGPAAPPDPRVLAQQAIATMGLRAVAIGIVPEARAGSVGIIGMPTWMWVADPGEQTWGPMTRSASAGGYTVTATAKVDRVVWVMGDGSTVTCKTPGTPYADSFGKKSSPDCGHTYTRQGTYVVAATSYWTVTWAGIGQTGTIPLDFTQQATIVMGESQVLSN
jgi:hypothetical protein